MWIDHERNSAGADSSLVLSICNTALRIAPFDRIIGLPEGFDTASRFPAPNPKRDSKKVHSGRVEGVIPLPSRMAQMRQNATFAARDLRRLGYPRRTKPKGRTCGQGSLMVF
jgi:hypothetical protein